MRRFSLLTVLCICIITNVFGQFKIDTEGFAKTSNISIDGLMGVPNINTPGVLTVTSNRMHERYNPFTSFTPALICARSQTYSIAFANFYNQAYNFYVTYDGQVYTKFGLITTSDSLCKENITELQPTMDKIRTLHGFSFDYKDGKKDARLRSASGIDEEEIQLGATPEISRQIAEERNRKRIGLIAQEVERVFPEAVRTSYDGTKGILYTDLIGVLIEGMKELQDSLSAQAAGFNSRITALEQQLAMLTSGGQQFAPGNDKSTPSGNAALGKEQAELYQNTPNPFNRETEISYRLSGDAVSAFICIYNLNGQQLKKYALSPESNAGKIMLSASEFTPGMYIYSLVINNRMIDSKRMTLTD